MIGITSGTSRFSIDKYSEVLGLRSMEKVISNRDDFVVDVLFHFEPVQRFEYLFWGFQLLREQGSF